MTGPTDQDLWFYASIGRLCMAWGSIEGALDSLIDGVHALGGRHIAGKRPYNLKDKVRYVRRVALHAAKSAGDADITWIDRLAADLEAQLKFRHDIIHGVLVDRDTSTHEAVVARIEHSEDHLRSRRVAVNTQEILRAATKADATASRLFAWSEEWRRQILQMVAAQSGP